MTTDSTRAWVIDTETTGLSVDDRIITLGAVELIGPRFTGNLVHLVFDPGRPSHFMARRAHGWADADLVGQDLFARHAGRLSDLFNGADLLVAHNMAFDSRFLNREFAAAGVPTLAVPCHCTMAEYKRRNAVRSARLDLCLEDLGLQRATALHGALEDAMLAACLHVDLAYGERLVFEAAAVGPTNLRRLRPSVGDLSLARR